MDIKSYYKEFLLPVSCDRAFKAIAIDGHNLIPKLLPHVIKSMDVTHGDGGPGSIKRVIFNEEDGRLVGDQFFRIDTLDPVNYVYQATLIKGSRLNNMLHSVVYENHFLALGPDKCVMKMSGEYHLKEDVKFIEEDIKNDIHAKIGIYKAVIAHLMENPDKS